MGFQFHFPPAIRTVTKVADEGMYSNKKINFFECEPWFDQWYFSWATSNTNTTKYYQKRQALKCINCYWKVTSYSAYFKLFLRWILGCEFKFLVPLNVLFFQFEIVIAEIKKKKNGKRGENHKVGNLRVIGARQIAYFPFWVRKSNGRVGGNLLVLLWKVDSIPIKH